MGGVCCSASGGTSSPSKKSPLHEKLILAVRSRKMADRPRSLDHVLLKLPQVGAVFKGCKKLFRQADTDANGLLNLAQVHGVLTGSHLALTLPVETLRALYDEAELDVGTQVDVREFVVLLCLCVLLAESGGGEGAGEASAASAAMEVKDLDRALNTLVEAFRFFDTGDKGWVTQSDVAEALGAHHDDQGHSTHSSYGDARPSPGGAAKDDGRRKSFERLKSLNFSFGSGQRISPPESFKTSDSMSRRFTEMDFSNDGKVTFPEFVQAIESWAGDADDDEEEEELALHGKDGAFVTVPLTPAP